LILIAKASGREPQILQQKPILRLQIGQYVRLSMNHRWHSANTRGWLDGSSVAGWIVVNTIAIIAPARNVMEPIRSKRR
jgi:hypothetical protein